MRFAVSVQYRRVLARGAAIALAGGVVSGCSSDVLRFQDSVFTGNSHPQQAQAVSQPYPGDYSNLDPTSTGSIAQAPRGAGILNRASPISRPDGNVQAGQQMAAAQNTWQQPVYTPPASGGVTSGPALAPVVRSSLDTTTTGSVQPVRTAVTQAAVTQTATAAASQLAHAGSLPVADSAGGWSRAGGTQVSVKPGETVYNLSRRFGVPVDAILKANGMGDANQLAAGQQVVIPTYVHSAQAPVSAPDANPNVADARSSTGSRFDVQPDRVPVPTNAPSERVAVLPQQPKVKEDQPGQHNAAASAPSGAAAGGAYTVVSGDTLHGIARKTGASVTAIKQANGLSDGLIRIGQTLTIPAGGASTQIVAAPAVDRAATAATQPPAAASYTPPKQAEAVIQQASLDTSAPAPDATGISRMRWPVRGRVISAYGSSGGSKNDGIDIAVPTGTPIKAAENGVVIYAGDGLKEFGNTVLVRHEDGLVTVYGHASELKVQRGQKVRRGEDIALAGMSGSADTPKLHFEVRKDSTPVDPARYLE